MSMDDCFIPLPSPLHDRWRRGSHPCLSQLDLDERAVAGFGTAGEGCSHGVPRRILWSPNRTVAVPPRRLSRPLDPLPMYKGNPLPDFPEEPKQQQVTVSRAASKGRYARFKENLNAMPEETKKHNHSQVNVSCATSEGRSRAGWISKDRSTPEGINMEEHGWRFQFSMPRPKWTGKFEPASVGVPVVMQKKKPPEVRNALREIRVAAKQKDARYHAEVALRKYNRVNNTKFELVEVKVISIFSEFGGAGAHYNFTAKEPEDQHSVDADCTKLFFSEVNLNFRSENDVIMCCIVGENDAGHCYGCENYQPVVHPSSQAYGGGSSTCIDYPGSDGDSDSTDSDDQ